jgi:hypothetical protein
MQLTQLYSALAQVRPWRLDTMVPMGLAFLPDDDVDLVGLTPIRALALATAHPDVAGVQAHVRLEQLVGRAWTWLVGSHSRRRRGPMYGVVGVDEARDAAHDEVRSALLLLALDAGLPRPQPTESAIKTLRNRECNRIGAAQTFRDLVTGPVSLEVLDSLNQPDSGLLINSGAVMSISDAGVHHLELLLKHVLDFGGYAWWWCRRSVLAGVGQAESWARVIDGLMPGLAFTDSGLDQPNLARNIEQLQLTLLQLERLVKKRRDCYAASVAEPTRFEWRSDPRTRGARPLRPPLTSAASRRVGRLLA